MYYCLEFPGLVVRFATNTTYTPSKIGVIASTSMDALFSFFFRSLSINTAPSLESLCENNNHATTRHLFTLNKYSPTRDNGP